MTATATLRTAPRLDVDRLIGDPRTRIIVCCGSGGVGKTTVAAALGLRAAEQGRNVVVLTVDPARRLAQSMGLTALDNTPRVVAGAGAGSGAGSHAGSGSRAGGSLHAMMLDMKRTFDEIVEAHADPGRAAQIRCPSTRPTSGTERSRRYGQPGVSRSKCHLHVICAGAT